MVNGNFYIGQTSKSKEERFQKHKYDATYGSKTYLHRAMRKYGFDNFTIEEIENQVLLENLDEREIFWIKKLNPKYNMTDGGEGCKPLNSPNFINAMKEYHSKKPKEEYATYGMLGKKFPDEAKEKVGRANSYPVVVKEKSFHQSKQQKNTIKV